ncbi:hypothetical protein [Desertivirga xinjiangensis]|uniref:hypothetical protein n=1 Tax=Desertivirga xinjiangensis TaxID=539206 RepID=UPI00210F1040|nr:hypothetical protein [Pedobacter xinjiangensis]
MKGLYKIDTQDVYETYRFIVSKGSDTFLQPRKRKAPDQYDWKDENGVEYDLADPTFEPRTLQLEGTIEGSDELDFQLKWNAFKTLWQLGGARQIEAIEIGETVLVFCEQFQQTERLTRMKGGNKVYVKVALTLKEVIDPFFDTLIIDTTTVDIIFP